MCSFSVLISCRQIGLQNLNLGTSLAVQWLRLRASNAGGTGLTPGWGTKIPHVMPRHGHKRKKKKSESIYSKADVLLSPHPCQHWALSF